MAVLSRRSPKLAVGYDKQDVRDALTTLEDRPRIPEKSPASSAADGYEGEICANGSHVFIYMNGSWKRAALSSF